MTSPPWKNQLYAADLALSTRNSSILLASIKVLVRDHGTHPLALYDASLRLYKGGYLYHAEKLLNDSLKYDMPSPDHILLLSLIYQYTLRHHLCNESFARLALNSSALMAMSYVPLSPLSCIYKASQQWAYSLPQITSFTDYNVSSDLMRIGFISADFSQHPVGFFLLPLIEYLASCDGVELFFYDNNSRQDWLWNQLHAFGTWCNISDINDIDLAHSIHSDSLSALVDLSGHTAGNRLTALRYKPSPVQITWLGYWSTTGLSGCFDAIFVDPFLVPEYSISKNSFSENLQYLPISRWCYRPVPWMPSVSVPPSIANGYITYGSFNSSSKLNINLIKCWSKILHATPSSPIYLKNFQLEDPELKDYIYTIFRDCGVDVSRVQLDGPSSHSDLLKSYSNVDIALDTFPFNGGLTSCEALWSGVPLISLSQIDSASHMAARQGESILRSINHPEWISYSQDDYIRTAVELAKDHDFLAVTRSKLRNEMSRSTLCDEDAFGSSFLSAITELSQSKSSL